MANQVDPARHGLAIAASGMLLLVGILDAATLLRGNSLLGALGVALAMLAATWLALSVRAFRRERARRD